jgi:hypothetical protein
MVRLKVLIKVSDKVTEEQRKYIVTETAKLAKYVVVEMPRHKSWLSIADESNDGYQVRQPSRDT